MDTSYQEWAPFVQKIKEASTDTAIHQALGAGAAAGQTHERFMINSPVMDYFLRFELNLIATSYI